MGWTKQDIIEAAFEELGLGAYAYDLRPEDLTTGLNRLNTLMAEWQGGGVGLGYPAGGTPDADNLTTDSNLPPDAVNGVIAGLAVALAPGYGKQPSRDTKIAARAGKNLVLRKSMTLPAKQPDTRNYPAGAGRKQRFEPMIRTTDSEVTPDERTT